MGAYDDNEERADVVLPILSKYDAVLGTLTLSDEVAVVSAVVPVGGADFDWPIGATDSCCVILACGAYDGGVGLLRPLVLATTLDGMVVLAGVLDGGATKGATPGLGTF